MADKAEILENVKEYYGKVLQSSDDLKTQACVAQGRALNAYVKCAISAVHEEVSARYYGCGLVIPAAVGGTKVLDLGSGSGRDCFALSKLVGEDGEVVGIDMTKEQIEVARQYIDYHTTKFNYSAPNTSFVDGFIEDLSGAGLQPSHFDIIVSNCVVNLSPDKLAVLKQAYDVLKEGGELYFSDVYTDTMLGDDVRKNKVLWGECISGALHWKQLHELAAQVGFSKPYLVTTSPIEIDRPEFLEILGDAKFCSATYRLFKLPAHKYAGTCVLYDGSLPGHEDSLVFDHKTTLETEKMACVSGDKVAALAASRFKDTLTFKELKEVDCAGVPEQEDPFEVLRVKKEKGENVEAACKKQGC